MFFTSFLINFHIFKIFETGLIEKNPVSEDDHNPILHVKISICYPGLCKEPQSGTDPGICWCCTSNKICTKVRQDCLNVCKTV